MRGSIQSPLASNPSFTWHLLRRTTFGLTPELLQDVTTAGGVLAWLDRQLNPGTIPDAACDAEMALFPLASVNPPEVYAKLSNGGWSSMVDVVRGTFARQIWSKRQLFEVMVEFWSNHLNITSPSSEPWATKAWDDRNVIRANALGRFDEMLVASMKSPAMLLYLNNSESRGSAPNENYGRELLELHTVGVDAGYGHDGVLHAAYALTGLTTWDPWNGGVAANLGTFRYRPEWHRTGQLNVLGWTHPNADRTAGVAVAESLGRYLANHPATAARIARKLVIRFVADNPPQALVNRLAKVYLDNQTAVVPVLRALFASSEFASSTGQKFRRPNEDVVASIRAVGMRPDPASKKTGAIANMCWFVGELENAPHGWHQPDGYPDTAHAWTGAGTTLGRWNLHAAVAQRWWKDGVTYPANLATHLLGPTLPATRRQMVDILIARLLPGQNPSVAHRAALVKFLGADGKLLASDLTGIFPILVGLVLDSPYWCVR
jgi:uncharacterized protein (DUF1800 family)